MTSSDLLPDEYSDFRTKGFWEGFFKARDGKAFEWYGDWTTLRVLLTGLISQDWSILVPGCGNSALSAQLYDTGRTKITNFDFSPTCVREMLSANVRERPDMRWLVMDMTKMTFEGGSFDCAEHCRRFCHRATGHHTGATSVVDTGSLYECTLSDH